jgi:hypothetical protein
VRWRLPRSRWRWCLGRTGCFTYRSSGRTNLIGVVAACRSHTRFSLNPHLKREMWASGRTIKLQHSLELSGFDKRQSFAQGFEDLLTLWLLQQIHRQSLKPTLHLPPSQFSPVRSDIFCNGLSCKPTAGMYFVFVISHAVLQLLNRTESKCKGCDSHKDDLGWNEVLDTKCCAGFFPDSRHATSPSFVFATSLVANAA